MINNNPEIPRGEAENILGKKIEYVVVNDTDVTVSVEGMDKYITFTAPAFNRALANSKTIGTDDSPRSLKMGDLQLIMDERQVKTISGQLKYAAGVRERINIAVLHEDGRNELQYLDYTMAENITLENGRVVFDTIRGPKVEAIKEAMGRITFQEYREQTSIQLLCPSSTPTILNVVSVTRAQFDELDKQLKMGLNFQYE